MSLILIWLQGVDYAHFTNAETENQKPTTLPKANLIKYLKWVFISSFSASETNHKIKHRFNLKLGQYLACRSLICIASY